MFSSSQYNPFSCRPSPALVVLNQVGEFEMLAAIEKWLAHHFPIDPALLEEIRRASRRALVAQLAMVILWRVASAGAAFIAADHPI